jgi:hypothetical protein
MIEEALILLQVFRCLFWYLTIDWHKFNIFYVSADGLHVPERGILLFVLCLFNLIPS